MIERLIEWSARNRLLVVLLTLAATAFSLAAARRVPVDALPDLSEAQVIVFSRWERAPELLERQVTYPIVAALLGTPRVKAIRAVTDFGFSTVYVVFDDGTDLSWARSRTLEHLSRIQQRLPPGARTELGPDATSVGWVFQYALVDDSNQLDLARLRSLQDWYLRLQLESVPGVAEVATVGGFEKQIQVSVLPDALETYGLTLMDVARAIREGNGDAGAGLLEAAGTELAVQVRGSLRTVGDVEAIAVGPGTRAGKPVLVQDVARVRLGPAPRRGVADLDGRGDAVGGIVILRSGESVSPVIERVKQKLEQLRGSLPAGVRVVTAYDRSELIGRALATLRRALGEELIVIALVILFFLWHVPSALIPIVTIPIAVALAFAPMALLGVSANLMSLSGIAISIGVLVDGAIVEVENAAKKIELWLRGGRQGGFDQVRLAALKEVGRPVFFSLLVVAVAFLPIFTLGDEEGRFFRPLAFTKIFVMSAAALLALTLDPALRMLLARVDPFRFRPAWAAWLLTRVLVGRYADEERHPVSRRLFAVYRPACEVVLRHPRTTLAAAGLLVLSAALPLSRLGSEFLPPLDEGTILYMPASLPGISITEAQRVLRIQDRILRSFPEVERVFGKAGRAGTSTDPAPLSMIETTVVLKPQEQWRKRARWYSGRVPAPLAAVLGRAWPEAISYPELIREMDAQLRIPGFPNTWTQPIRNRNDMLATGMRTPVGIKVLGGDLAQIERLAAQAEGAARAVPGTRSAFAERVSEGSFVDVTLRREQLARYGLTVKEVEDAVAAAVGGENVTTAIDGRERFEVNVRYARDFRDELEKLPAIRIPARTESMGAFRVPLGELADVRRVRGPAMIRDEDGLLAAYVFLDFAGRDLGSYAAELEAVLARIPTPPGCSIQVAGQYQGLERFRARLWLVVPLVLGIIALLLLASTGSWVKTAMVLLAVPFSLVGAVWLMALLGHHLSTASWVGMISLMGLDAETGVFMLLYLDLAHQQAVRDGRMSTRVDLQQAAIEGAVKRIRPKMMTVTAAMLGLLPILWANGAGADLMKRVAAPMVGGLFTSFLLELLVYPVLFVLWKGRSLEPDATASR